MSRAAVFYAEKGGEKLDLEARAAALVNQESGLANDYLNVFNELVMLVEQLPEMHELIDDLLAWRPRSYEEYFKTSSLPGSGLALEAYSKLDPDFRKQFDDIVAELDRAATGSLAAIRRQLRRDPNDTTSDLAGLCQKASLTLRQILTRATDIVNHGLSVADEAAQQRAERLLAVRVQAITDVVDFHSKPRFAQG